MFQIKVVGLNEVYVFANFLWWAVLGEIDKIKFELYAK
jgi:hypothetical protein